MKSFHCQSLPRTLISLATAVLFLLYALPALAVSITAPKDNSQVKGVVHIAATPDKGEEGYAYAILLVDNERHSIANVQPLRFEVDTANLTDGAHLLQVQLSDMVGVLSKSKTVRIIVANRLPARIVSVPNATADTPKPTTVSPAAMAPRPIRGAELTVVMDGKPLLFTVKPIIEKGRAMVLLRPLIEAMGGQLGWDPVKKQAIATVEGRQYLFTIGENAVTVNGESTPIDRPATISAGRTIIPINIWRDVFGGTVHYDAVYGCITLDSGPRQTIPEATIASNQ